MLCAGFASGRATIIRIRIRIRSGMAWRGDNASLVVLFNVCCGAGAGRLLAAVRQALARYQSLEAQGLARGETRSECTVYVSIRIHYA